MIMKNLELILLFILAFTLFVQVFPFVKGFYDGYTDAINNKPFKQNKDDETC
tara:strand:+ start:266 stop:421 length:156 start_codon:yes stop_codon:yes gene_type:complete